MARIKIATSAIDSETLDPINALINKTGLDQIEAGENEFQCVKVDVKNAEKHTFVPVGFVQEGIPMVQPYEDVIMLRVSGSKGFSDYLRTSPVVKCSKVSDGFLIETENSFYLLRELTNGKA